MVEPVDRVVVFCVGLVLGFFLCTYHFHSHVGFVYYQDISPVWVWF
jgi:hypothetical protein